MFVLTSYPAAVLFCVITMLCWGSWANTRKLARKDWRFELYYWDYVIGVLVVTVIFGLTLGSTGAVGRPFVTDLAQGSHAKIESAILGGAIFNLANILLVAAIDIAGMSVAFPVGIGLALVLGVLVNYIARPLGNPSLLFAGVILVVLAIVLDAAAYRRIPGGRAGLSTKGLILAIACGIFMGFFYRFVAAAMYPDFAHPEPGALGPYAAVFAFAVGIVLSSVVVNTFLMRKPLVGAPVPFADYLKADTRTHLTGVLGGLIWGTGMEFSIIASGRAGFAVSYGLGQGATMIAALWGVVVWKEFRSAPAGTSQLITAMFCCFLAGIALIIAARLP